MKKFYLHSNQLAGNTVHTLKRMLVFAIIFSMVLSCFSTVKISKADANSSVSVRIDYLEEIAVVTAPPGGTSTRFYMSTDGKKTWELLDVTGIVDISSLLATKAVTLSFKGNKDLMPVEKVLDAEDPALQVAYQIIGGVGKIQISNTTLPVEFRKGSNGVWRTATNLMTTAMYEVKGATLYFRTTATSTRRAGKIITIKISKRPTAPSVKLDASKLSITGLKIDSTQYRVGNSDIWTTFKSPDPKAKSIDLASLLLAVSPSAITLIPAGVIEFRTVGADKKLYSAVKIIEVPLQPVVVPEKITLTGTKLTITDINTKVNYEYTIVKSTSTLNLNTATWSTVTSRMAVVIPRTKVNVGDKVLVRLKSTTDPTTKQIILASTYKEMTVTSITQN